MNGFQCDSLLWHMTSTSYSKLVMIRLAWKILILHDGITVGWLAITQETLLKDIQ